MIRLVIPQPSGMSFVEWGGVLSEQLADYGVSAPQSEAYWKTWVAALFYVEELAAVNLPSADGFARWQDWADAFIGSVR